MCLQCIIHQRLVSATSLLGSGSKLIKHCIINVNRDASLPLGGHKRAALSLRKIVFSSHMHASQRDWRGEQKSIGFLRRAKCRPTTSRCPAASRTERHVPLLTLRVRIKAMQCERVHKHAFRIRKGHAVLTQIPRRLGRIKLELHDLTICMLCIRVKDDFPELLTPEVRGAGESTTSGID